MINVIIPVVDKPQVYLPILNEIAGRKDCRLYIGALEKFKDVSFPKNAEVKFYKADSKKEEILNSLHAIEKERGQVIIIRRPLESAEFKALIESRADIAYLKKPKSRFSAWWANLWKKLIKKIFAFYYFEDISAVKFNENTFNLISSLTNLSYITRIDRFVGLKEETISSKNRSPRREYNRAGTFFKLFGAILFFALMVFISVFITIRYQPVSIMVLISILLCVIGIVALFMAILNFVRTLYVGKLRHGRAEEC